MPLLRKLGNSENFYLRERITFTNIFMTKSRIDLINNQEIVKAALHKWKLLNQILRCKVSTRRFKDEDECHYFESTEDDSQKKNVFFLYTNAGDKPLSDTSILWKLLANKMTLEDFSLEHDLLWRLIFFKLDENKSEHMFNYCVIFSANHSIIDGHSAYVTILQLFKLIEELSQHVFTKIETHPLIATVEDLFAHKVSHEHLRNYDHKSIPAKPLLINGLNREMTQICLPPLAGIFEADNKLFITIAELHASFNAVAQLQSSFTVNEDTLSKLIVKCQHNNLKLNGCINMILLIALKMTYAKYTRFELEKIIYFNSISLRNYVAHEERSRFQTLGYMSNSIYKEFAATDSVDLLLSNFWENAMQESNEMHTRFENNEQFYRSKWLEPGNDELHFHYFLSNLGVKKASMSSEAHHESLIHVAEHYKVSNLFERKFKGIFFGSMTTVNNKMFWSLLFSTKTVNLEFATFFEKSVLDILKLII